VATQIGKNCCRQQPHSHLTSPWRGTPWESAYTLYFQKLESLAYIFVAACMGLSLFKFVLQMTHLFWTRLRFVRSRSFRVIHGRWFWYQSKARIRLPISPSLWLWSYLAPFLRYVDLLAKNCLFLLHLCYPSLIRHPHSLCSLWNFPLKLTVRKLVMGLSSSEDHVIVAGVILAWYQSMTDGQTVGRSDRIYHNKLFWPAVKT